MPECSNGNHCCCEVCITERLDCDNCCRCIPESFCVRFEGGPYCDCSEAGDRIYKDQDEKTYSGFVPCGGEPIDVYLEVVEVYGQCMWHLVSNAADVDAYYAIRGDDPDAVGCENPTFEFDTPCGGSVSISRYEGGKVEFESCDFFCGACRCTCVALCAVQWINGVAQERQKWEWNEFYRSWGDASLVKLEDGSCGIQIGDDIVELEGPCDEISINTIDVYGNGYVLNCWECTCDSETDLVVSTCCGQDPLPRVLFATIERVSDVALCGDYATTVVPLIWQGEQPHPDPLRTGNFGYWAADVSFGDCGSTTIVLFCDNTDCVPVPGIICSNAVLYSVNAVGGTGNKLACIDSLTCLCFPYFGEFTLLPFDAGLSCANPNCAFKITVSE